MLLILYVLVSSILVSGVYCQPSPQSLQQFWPLNVNHGLRNYVNSGWSLFNSSARLMSSIAGPFGSYDAAFSVSCDRCSQGYASSMTFHSTFSLSFFAYFRGLADTGFFEFATSQFGAYWSYKDRKVFVQVNRTILYSSANSFLKPYTWNFLAITMDSSRTLRLYNETTLIARVDSIITQPGSGQSLYIGRHNTNNYNMFTTDAIACFMYYNTTLTLLDILKLPPVCKDTGPPPPATVTSVDSTTTTATAIAPVQVPAGSFISVTITLAVVSIFSVAQMIFLSWVCCCRRRVK